MHSMQQTNEIFILTNLKDFHTGKKSNLLKRQLIAVLCIISTVKEAQKTKNLFYKDRTTH